MIDLEKERKELAHAQALAKIGSWSSDLESKTLMWSDETYRIFGMSAKDGGVSYEAFFERVHPDDREMVATAFDLSVLRHQPFMYEHRIVLTDGTLKWVQERCEFFYDQDGRPLRAAGTTQDITDRVTAAQALRQSDERFRLVVQATTDVVWDWNLLDDTCWWSAGLETRFGYQAGSYSSPQFWAENIHPDDCASVLQRVHAAIEHDSIWAAEYRFRKADGAYAQVSDRAILSRNGDGRAHRMIGAMVDVTQQRSLESRLATTQRLAGLGQLAANVAHEFNNVLMEIQPFAEVIARVTKAIPVATDAAGHILESVRRGKEVTAEIMRFTGRFGPIGQPLDVHDWLLELAPEDDAEGVPVSIPAAGARSRRVLIVDDEPVVVQGISMLLESEGVESASVFEGLAAIAAIERHDPDVVLLDIGLPDISGVEVFGRIQTRWPSRRIVLMTGHYSPHDIATILELPNVGFLQKPFGVDELLAALAVAPPS